MASLRLQGMRLLSHMFLTLRSWRGHVHLILEPDESTSILHVMNNIHNRPLKAARSSDTRARVERRSAAYEAQ